MPVNKRDFKAPSRWKSGIGPEKELLMKLIVRRPRSWCKALTSIFPERPKPVRWRPVMAPSKQMTPNHLAEQGEELAGRVTQEVKASAWVNDCLSLRRASVSETAERERRGRRKKMRRKRGRTAAIAEPEMGGQVRRERSRCSQRIILMYGCVRR